MFPGENVTDWPEFWVSFEAAVHTNTTLSDVDKLNYLRSKVSDEALRTIEGVKLSNGNYAVAVQLLRDRYGDQQAIIDAHYTALMGLPVATEDAAALRVLYDKLESRFRCLAALKEDVYHIVFNSMITSKLPASVLQRMEMAKQLGTVWPRYAPLGVPRNPKGVLDMGVLGIGGVGGR